MLIFLLSEFTYSFNQAVIDSINLECLIIDQVLFYAVGVPIKHDRVSDLKELIF